MADKKPPGPGKPEGFRPHHNVDKLRVPPQSVESEQAVLGGLMLAPERLAAVQLLLGEEDFYRRDHRLIFRGMADLADKRRPFDAVTLGEWFEANGLSEQIGGPSYLIELASTTPSAANIIAYADIVKEHSVRRRLIGLGTDIVNDGFQPDGHSSEELLQRLQGALGGLVQLTRTADLMRAADLSTLMGQQLQPPRFLVDPYLPESEVTLFGSHGGAGKTTAAMIVGAHVATGRWVFGHRVDEQPQRVVVFSLEDDAAKAAYKLQRIVDAYELDADLVRQHLRLYDWSHGDTALVREVSQQGVRDIEATPLWGRLQTAAAGARLVIVDNASECFDGDENNRRQVKKFVGMLRDLARAQASSVLLLAHIDKAAARNGGARNNFSGSTAWHNSTRSRLTLIEENDAIELRQEKLNYGAKAEPYRLRWAEHGVLVPIGDGSKDESDPDPESAKARNMAGVLKAMRAAKVGGNDVRATRAGQGNMHLLLSSMSALPARLKGKKGAPAFWEAVDQLIDNGQLVVETRLDAYRHPRQFVTECRGNSGPLSAQQNSSPHPTTVRSDAVTQRHTTGLDRGVPQGVTQKSDALTQPDFRQLQAGDDPGEST